MILHSSTRFLLLIFSVMAIASGSADELAPLALYSFEDTAAGQVLDHSGNGFHLHVQHPDRVHREVGMLEVRHGTRIATKHAPAALIRAIRDAEALTLEVWVRAAKTEQTGPARIVTLSRDSNLRNLTLGQNVNKFDTRVRTTSTSLNGLPSLSGDQCRVETSLQHVVFTRKRNGQTCIHLNGRRVATGMAEGTLSNWDAHFRLLLANEDSGDRPWLGQYFHVALYAGVLPEAEIQARFKGGLKGRVSPAVLANPIARVEPPAPVLFVGDGLLLLYDFSEGSGETVYDRSGHPEPLNLHIETPGSVQWEDGSLLFDGTATIRSPRPAIRLSAAIRKSKAFSLDVWADTEDLNQEGPARLVSLSKHTSERLFTIGQHEGLWDVRFRTSKSDKNGSPSMSSEDSRIHKGLSHVVYSREAGGLTRLFVNGRLVNERHLEGGLDAWREPMHLLLGNEQTGDRPWKGRLHRVALYNRALSSDDVMAAHEAGALTGAELTEADSARLFEAHIAPMLSRHCLECHDAATREGRLDLSRKQSAFAPRKNEQTIVPGDAANSLLWTTVHSDEMPEDRDALSPVEKSRLAAWINSGAVWTLPMIDPVLYEHGGASSAAFIQRLTVGEYIATVQATFGLNVTEEARRRLPPDQRTDGFKNTSYNLTVDLKHVESYAELAGYIVERLDLTSLKHRFGFCDEDNPACLAAALDGMGRWVLRGRLSERERKTYQNLVALVRQQQGDTEEAIGLVLQAMVQSPRFIYRLEDQNRPLPLADELASRMSYILWGASPDEELLRAAAAGQLDTRDGVEKQIKRMLADRRVVEHSIVFLRDWLSLDRLTYLRPSKKHYPTWSPDLAADFRAETEAFFESLVWTEQRPLWDLFDAQFSVVSPRLAAHYGWPKPEGSKGRVNLQAIPARGGLLTHASVLTIGGDESSMVARGLFVMHNLLRGVVKSPPPCVDTTPVPTGKGTSQRQIAERRIADASCGGCHAKFEPLAFGLERYDGLGVYREVDAHGNDLRADGALPIPGQAKASLYTNPDELMTQLAKSERVRESLTWKIVQFSLGRPLGPADAGHMATVHAQAQKAGGRYADVLTALLLSDLVLKNTMETAR